MRKVIFVSLGLALLMVLLVATVSAGGGGAYRGEGIDPNNTWLGTIKYLATPAGYHFWFTPSADIAWYEAGHSYHNVYQATVDDPSEWCVCYVPNRPPYNEVGFTGQHMYFKIFDTTTDTQIAPPCGF
jgi:hypothetical protein